MAQLDGPRRDAAAEAPTALVIFLHGYGADGNDLIGIAEPLAPLLPGAAFVSPNAPDPCAASPFGRQWFPIPWIDGSSEEAALAGLERSRGLLDAFIDAEAARLGVPDEKIALFGFSQGAMLSLHTAPRRAAPLGHVAAFSGRLLAAERLESEAISKPPVTLVHGDADDVVPPSSLDEARGALGAAGFDVRWRLCRGVGHGIAPEGLQIAAEGLVAALRGSG